MKCKRVAERKRFVSAEMMKWVDDSYDVIALVLSCALIPNFEVALKVGKPVARQAAKAINEAAAKGKTRYLASECPLAGYHIVQGIEREDPEAKISEAPHPIKLFAEAYGLKY